MLKPLPLLRSILAVAFVLSGPAQADEPWKLLPLEYNNSGLSVDHGVGLAAWFGGTKEGRKDVGIWTS